MNTSEEAALVKRAQGGDMSAFESLVREYERFVYNLAYKLLNDQQDAEDASQEAFIKAFRSISSFRGDSKFSVWLYRLTSNVCIDMLRRRPAPAVSLSVDDDGADAQLDIPDIRFQPENELERQELRRAVGSALSSLPDNYRQVLVLREIGGHSYDEIAGSLHLDLGTVKSRIFRARKKLCSILAADGNIFGHGPSNSGKGGADK